MVSLFLQGVSTPLAWLPFHQSQGVLPGLTQLSSPMALGGFKLTTMLDSTRRPGWSAIMRTRQADCTGVRAMTDSFDASALGSKDGAMLVLVFTSSTRVARRAARVRLSGDAVTYRLE